MTALSKTGARMLAKAEVVIERGLSTFLQVGDALANINDGRLYREEYDTFEAYCRGRWAMSARRARQLMDAAQMGTMVPISNERQARALKEADDPAEVYAEAEKRGDTTSAGIGRVVAERKNPRATNGSDQSDGGRTPTDAVGPDDDEQEHGSPASSPAPKVAPPVDPALNPDETAPCPTCGGSGIVSSRAVA